MKQNQTKNYEQFSLMTDNREISQANVERLKNSIKTIGFISGRPVLVNKKFEILDGAHRYFALKQLGLPITYQIQETSGHKHDEAVVKQLNINQAVLTLTDWVHKHAANGKVFYKEVERFKNEWKLDMTGTLVICCDGQPRSKDIIEGIDMKLNPKRVATVEFLLRHKEVPFRKTKKFVYAVSQMFKRCTGDQIRKVEKKIWSVPQQASSSGYLIIFENIINKHVPTDQHITLAQGVAMKKGRS